MPVWLLNIRADFFYRYKMGSAGESVRLMLE